jgi:radical SAM protein with 4Fe4S-binding SPASM domain
VEKAQECLKISEIQLTGGEPLQRPDIFSLIRTLQEKGLNVILQTNGFFSHDTAHKILDLANGRLNLIFSLDGFETNDYFRGIGVSAKVVENIELLSKALPIRINTLLSSKIKWEEIERLASLAEKHSLLLAFNPICAFGKANSSLVMPPKQYFRWMYQLENLRSRGISIRKSFDVVNGQLVEKESCPVRKGATIHTSADGTAYPCGYLVNKEVCFLGSIRETSILDLMKRIPDECRSLHPECQKCEYLKNEKCFGGCPARTLSLTGSFQEKDIYCMAENQTFLQELMR